MGFEPTTVDFKVRCFTQWATYSHLPLLSWCIYLYIANNRFLKATMPDWTTNLKHLPGDIFKYTSSEIKQKKMNLYLFKIGSLN